jgi:uncharacterized protein YbjT (DUF2867 family)
MNILILGATGFIGSAVAQKLVSQGHDITGLGRSLASARRRFPQVRWIDCDLRNFREPADWLGLTDGIDAVVNCAGALQDTPRDDVAAVQDRAMQALYQSAAGRSGLRIVQISAARILAGSNTQFMDTKLKADTALALSGLDHVIIRPALVIGRNAHGGSALLRALAAMPFALPLAYPDSLVETVSLDRLTGAVAQAIAGEIPNAADIDLIDSRCTLRALAAANRNWLGLPPAPVIAIPGAVAAASSKLADAAGRLGWRSPLRSTAMVIAKSGIAAGGSAALQGNPLPPDMSNNPSAVQDLWFARLYALKPLIFLTLSLFWIISGMVPLADPGGAAARFGAVFTPSVTVAIALVTSIADIMLGVAVLWRRYARTAMSGMLGLSLVYLIGGTIIEPSLWLDPLGPLVKVLPSILLTLTGLAILEER